MEHTIMLSNATLGLCAGLAALVGAPLALAQDAITAPAQKTIGQPRAT
jgi:hypothetical protein